eukprot:6212022-Pleurochrysis_carterae.AAC.1
MRVRSVTVLTCATANVLLAQRGDDTYSMSRNDRRKTGRRRLYNNFNCCTHLCPRHDAARLTNEGKCDVHLSSKRIVIQHDLDKARISISGQCAVSLLEAAASAVMPTLSQDGEMLHCRLKYLNFSSSSAVAWINDGSVIATAFHVPHMDLGDRMRALFDSFESKANLKFPYPGA